MDSTVKDARTAYYARRKARPKSRQHVEREPVAFVFTLRRQAARDAADRQEMLRLTR